MPAPPTRSTERLRDRPGAWVDLALTLPIFVAYHLAVVFLDVKNATDMVTGALMALSANDRQRYLLVTLGIGVVFAATFALLGRGQAFHPRKFIQILVEGTVYAFAMAMAANYVVGTLFTPVQALTRSLAAAAPTTPSAVQSDGRFVGFIMSLGAGFYEELSFRVLLFGLGAKVLVWWFVGQKMNLTGTAAALKFSVRSFCIMVLWALVCALVFSGVHYVGPMADDFKLTSFTFRAVLGLLLTLIYVTRGFSTAVWTHAIYDVWVLVLRGV
jgi:hypothetical protein